MRDKLYKKVILMREDGKTYKEIKKETGLCNQTIKTYLENAGLKQIKEK